MIERNNCMTVLEAARELGKTIQADPRYEAYVAAKNANALDDELNALIEKLNSVQEKFNTENAKDSPNRDLLDACDKSFREIYSKIMVNESMMNYENVKRKIDDMMNGVLSVLQQCVNGADPSECIPETAQGCSGSCADCSGC